MYELIKKVSLIVIIFGIATYLKAKPFYVDKYAFGNNNGTSWINAWQSFTDIDWSSIKPGDTIFISGGSDSTVYKDFMSIGASGSSGNLITITKGVDVGHNGRVIIDGQGAPYSIAFLIENQNYIKISNFEIKRFSGGGSIRVVESMGSIVDNNKILGYGSCIKIYYSTNCRIRNNTLTTHDYTSTQTDGIFALENTDNIYENNYIVVYNQHPDPHCDCIQLHKENSCIVRNNYMEQINDKTSNSQGLFDKEGNGKHIYYNNVVIVPNLGNSAVVAYQNNGIGTGTVRAYNNTIIGGDKNVFFIDAPDAIVKNNIFVTTGPHAHVRFYLKITNMSNIDYNLYYRELATGNDVIYAPGNGGTMTLAEWQGQGGDINGINADPSLSPKGKISAVSPALNRGADLTSVGITTDINGVPRPQHGRFDMGAFELVGDDSTPPSPPQNLHVKN